MKKSIKIAFSGIIGGLALMVMWFGNFDFSTFFMPAFAGILISVVYTEIDAKMAWSLYLAVSLLCIVVTQNREILFLFIFFFGFYPTYKLQFEKHMNKKISIVVKFAIFNVGAVATYGLYFVMFGVNVEMFSLFGLNLPLLFLVLYNILFFLYDILLVRINIIYHQRIHPHAIRWLKK